MFKRRIVRKCPNCAVVVDFEKFRIYGWFKRDGKIQKHLELYRCMACGSICESGLMKFEEKSMGEELPTGGIKE